MIPEQRLSTVAVPSEFLSPDDEDLPTWVAKELGGIGLNNPSQGLQVQTWTLRFVSGDIRISAPNTPEVTLFSAVGITELDLAFDQNMRPVVSYVQSGQAKFRWYDSLVESQVITDLPAGTITPRVTLDDKRFFSYGSSDVILAYVLNGNLYFRAQRDRFGVEYLLKENVGGRLIRIGMNNNNRLQFLLEEVDV